MTTAERILRAKQDIDEVYEAGKSQGGLDFNEILSNGALGDYRYQFAGAFWNDGNFKPTCNIRAGYAEKMFAYSKITNLKQILEDYGVSLDISEASKNNNVTQIFQGSSITDVGVLDISQGTPTYLLNGAQKLINVEKIILKNNGSQVFTGVFDNCKALKEIRFEGVIGKTLNFRWSTDLSADSLYDIVTHLSDSSTGQTITLPTTAESTYNAKYGDGAWATLLSTKQNWSIAYA